MTAADAPELLSRDDIEGLRTPGVQFATEQQWIRLCDQAERAADLGAKFAAAERRIQGLTDKIATLETCGCSYDSPDDVCMHHSPKLVRAEAALVAAQEAMRESCARAAADYYETNADYSGRDLYKTICALPIPAAKPEAN